MKTVPTILSEHVIANCQRQNFVHSGDCACSALLMPVAFSGYEPFHISFIVLVQLLMRKRL